MGHHATENRHYEKGLPAVFVGEASRYEGPEEGGTHPDVALAQTEPGMEIYFSLKNFRCF